MDRVKATGWNKQDERLGGDVKNWRIGDRKTETREPDGKLGESNGGQLGE
jgi:hypothetical protein